MFHENKPRIKRVFLYLRKSTEEKSERQVRSIADQKSDCIRLAKRLGLEVVEEFIENKSAWKPKLRPVFREMLKQLSFKDPRKRQADGILAWHPNRLSRNALEAGMLVQMLDDDQIKDMFFAAYSFHNDTSGKEHLTIEFARAKGYTDQLSDVVTRGIKSRESEGAMVYPVKFGYVKRREHEKAQKCSLFPIPHKAHFPIVKRMFELAESGYGTRVIVEYLAGEFPDVPDFVPALPTIDRRLRDTFYCGKWVVGAGTKKERVIDLMKITLGDGTKFTPVLSEKEFFRIQTIRSGNKVSLERPRKRVNPLPKMVTCFSCEKKMYPVYRKITRSGGVKEEQLGYECQSLGCSQSRIKAEPIFSFVAEKLAEISVKESTKHYLQYVLAIKIFAKTKESELKSNAAKISTSLKTVRAEKRKLIEGKAELVRQASYDKHSKTHFETRILELEQLEEGLLSRKSETGENGKKKIQSFVQFLELIENLHQYWLAADYTKKEQISKNLLWNLIVDGSEVRSGSWLQPFSECQKTGNFLFGRPEDKQLELRSNDFIKRISWLWECFSREKNLGRIRDMNEVFLGVSRLTSIGANYLEPTVRGKF